MIEQKSIDATIAKFAVINSLPFFDDSTYMQIQSKLTEIKEELEFSDATIDLLVLWELVVSENTDPATVLHEFLNVLAKLLDKLKKHDTVPIATHKPAASTETEKRGGSAFTTVAGLSEKNGDLQGRYGLEIDLFSNPQQAIDFISGQRITSLSQTCVFNFRDPFKSQADASNQRAEIYSPEKTFGTVLHVQPDESIVFVSPDGSAKKYYQGTYAKQELPANSICFVNHGGAKSEIFRTSIGSNNAVEFLPYVHLPDPMFGRIEREMLQFIGKSSHEQTHQFSTHFLELLIHCKSAADNRENIPIIRDKIWAALDSHPLLAEPSGRVAKERWKDMLNGSLAGGWQASVRSQTLVNQLYTGEPQRLNHTDVEAYYHAVFSHSELKKLIESWKNSGKISDVEFQEFQSEERFNFRGGSIWTLAEVVIADIANSERKAAVHEQLVQYCYAVKAANTKPSFSEFSTEIMRLAISLPEIKASLNAPMVWEYLHSEVTGEYSAVYAAMLDRLLLEVTANESMTAENKKDRHRTIAGKLIDTLRYNDEGKMVIIQCQLGDVVGPESPLHYYLRARSQTADTVIEYHIPLASHPQLLEYFKSTNTQLPAANQETVEQKLAAAQLAECLGGDTESCPAFGTDTDTLLTEFLDTLLEHAFTDETIDLLEETHLRNKYAADIIALLSFSTHSHKNQSIDQITGQTEDRSQKIIEYLQNKGQWNKTQLHSLLNGSENNATVTAHFRQFFKELNDPNSNLSGSNPELRAVLQRLLLDWLQEKKSSVRKATNTQLAKLILAAKQIILEHHGWGASSVGTHPFNEVAATQKGMEQTIFVTCSHMGSSGTNSIQFSNRQEVHLVKKAKEQQQDFSTYAAWNVELAKLLGVYSREQVTLLGHSMGGMIVLFSALLLPVELWEKTGILSVTPVVTNNEQKIKLIDFIRIVMENEQIKEAFQGTQIWKNLVALGTYAGEFELGLLLARAKNVEHEYIVKHLGILEADSTSPNAVSLAGLITEIVTNGQLGPINSLVVNFGDKIFLNRLIYKQLVQHCDDRISAEHGYQLATFVQTFLVNVTNILHEARPFSEEEIAYLKKYLHKIKIIVATGDRVLKPQFAIVLLEELLDAIVIAHNSPEHEEGHYALGDLLSNMLLGVEILVNFYDQARSKKT